MNRMSSERHQTRLNGRVAIEMDKVNSKMDPMGRAIADYHKTKKASKLRVFSPMFEEDEIPLTTLFRSYDSMPKIERKALDLAKLLLEVKFSAIHRISVTFSRMRKV